MKNASILMKLGTNVDWTIASVTAYSILNFLLQWQQPEGTSQNCEKPLALDHQIYVSSKNEKHQSVNKGCINKCLKNIFLTPNSIQRKITMQVIFLTNMKYICQ
jgi:hypothetical protein